MHSTETNLKEKSHDKLLKLKSFIEELELQLALGKSEAIDELENQKKSLKSFIIEQKYLINNIDLDNKKNELKSLFEELQLTLGKAETMDLVDESWNLITDKIKNIEKNIKNLSHEQKIFFESFGFKTDRLKYLSEILKLEFALGKAELKDKIEEFKKNFVTKLHIFKFQIKNDVEDADVKLVRIHHEIEKDFNAFISGIKAK